MPFDWGAMAGGAQQGLEDLIARQILEEKMALAQRQQAAEEAHRAALLKEQQADREQRGGQFQQTHGLNVRRVEGEESERPSIIGLRTAQTGRVNQETADAQRVSGAQDILMQDPNEAPTMRKVLAGFRAPSATQKQEQEFESGEAEKDRRSAERRAAIGATAMGGSRPISQTAKANLTTTLRKDYNSNVKEARTIGSQIGLMDESWKNYDANPASASQGILVTFQKILDPNSVVRESEYARSMDGTPLGARMRGAYERLVQGGAGIPKSELEGYRNLAKQWAQGYQQRAQRYQQVIANQAQEYEIPMDQIAIGDEFGGSGGGAPDSGETRRPVVSKKTGKTATGVFDASGKLIRVEE